MSITAKDALNKRDLLCLFVCCKPSSVWFFRDHNMNSAFPKSEICSATQKYLPDRTGAAAKT